MSDALRSLAVTVIDDDVDHTVIARHVLQALEPSADIRVLTRSDDLVADLHALTGGSLVLLDHYFGQIDTIELLPGVVAARGDLTVVLLSAAITEPDRRAAESAGAHLVAQKPLDLAGWRALLSDSIRTARARQNA